MSTIAALIAAAAFFSLRHPLLLLQFDGAFLSRVIDRRPLGSLLDFSSLAIHLRRIYTNSEVLI
jgi:hypothetical protein